MSEVSNLDPPTTIAEFDAFLAQQADPRQFELVEGRVVMDADQTERDQYILASMGTALFQVAKPLGFLMYFGGIRVQESDDMRGLNKVRPDLLVRSGEIPSQDYVTDPLAVIEILSPAKIDIDRGPKLKLYQRLRTMQHIAMFYQDRIRVEHYRRTLLGWKLDVLESPNDVLAFKFMGFAIGLSESYYGTHLMPNPKSHSI